MELKLSENLQNLAKLFAENKSTLYVVGGYCRNAIMEIAESDIDICGSLQTEKVQELCVQLGFRNQVVNKKLGTLLITCENEQFEYTTLRIEKYKGAEHCPYEVLFVDDCKEDAKRRDFSCNAIYYDILNKKFLDFYSGMSDIKHKKIKCVETPNFVFSSDGLRLLRLVRFASSLGFKVEGKTFKNAKSNASNLLSIKSERKVRELEQIACSDLTYGIKNAHKNACKLINKLGLWNYVFMGLKPNFKLKTSGKCFNVFYNAVPQDRFVCLCVSIVLQIINKYTSSVYNLDYLVNLLFNSSSFKCSNNQINKIMRYLIIITAFNKMNVKNKNSVREVAIMLYEFDNPTFLQNLNYKKYKLLQNEIEEMHKNLIPFTIKSLKVVADDIIKLKFIENKFISLVLKDVFNECVFNNLKNNKEEILNYIKLKYGKKNK